MNSGLKNLVVMGATMLLVKRLDQEDPDVITSTRLAFAAYLMFYLAYNAILHVRVTSARDLTELEVPVSPVPSLPLPNPDAVSGDTKTRKSTVLAYDLNMLSSARKSWLFHVAILTLIHFKTGSVSPLIMSAVTALARIPDDPLCRLHIRRQPSVGSLKRPFPPESNALAGMLQSMLPKTPGLESASDAGEGNDSTESETRTEGNRNGPSRSVVRAVRQSEPEVEEDLHDDGEDDDDGRDHDEQVNMNVDDESEGDDFKDDEAN